MRPADYAAKARQLVNKHEKWRVGECLNISAAENFSSSAARQLLASDFVNRYSDERGFHKGAKYLGEVEELAVEITKKVFRSKFADVRLISGHLCDVASILNLTKKGDTILSVAAENGGYPGISTAGIGSFIGTKDLFFPFDQEQFNIDIEKSKALLERRKPRLVAHGASRILFPQPVKELAKSSSESVRIYDGSHVLGLIAGGEFQDPLNEGCSLLIGSTHKSFPGPQGGIIVSNDEEVFNQVSGGIFPGLVDNIHWNRVAALVVVMAEMLQFGKEYARAIVRNSQALGKTLDELGVEVKGAKYGYSRSHQVILDYGEAASESLSNKLEQANIIADSGIRLGVSEVTRLGMGPNEMYTVGELVSSIVLGRESPTQVAKKVRSFVSEFREPKFVLA